MNNNGIEFLPSNTVESPFLQWEFLTTKATALSRKVMREKSTSSSNRFKLFLKQDGSLIGYVYPDPFELKVYLKDDIAVYFKNYLLKLNDKKALSLGYCFHLLSYFNELLGFAINNKWVNGSDFIFPKIPYSIEGNNGTHAAYSDYEVGQIKDALRVEIFQIDRILKNEKVVKASFPDLLEIRWMEEAIDLFMDPEVLNSIPTPGINTFSKSSNKRARFYRLAGKLGGLRNFYQSLGVIDLVDYQIIGSLLMKLSIETGLNPCSLFSLKIDCLSEKDLLTGMPIIKFVKYRSGGARDLYISLKDKDLEIQDLKQKQYLIIKKTIERTLAITNKFRSRAPAHLTEKLFIYESRSPRKFGEIIAFDEKSSHDFCQYLKVTYKLLAGDQKSPLPLMLVRFRATKLTQMVKEGRDIFEIQATAVHGSVKTTFIYFYLRSMEPKLADQDRKGLEGIWNNIKNSTISVDNKSLYDGKETFKGVFSNCKNVFDPPEEVMRLKGYHKGQACTYYNMCLTCKNVIITVNHLPILINYREELLLADSIATNEAPLAQQNKRMLSIMNSLLDEEKSMFSKDDLRIARVKAELTRGEYIDPTFYVPSKI